jgi:phosphotransferase system enzyme I (PtsI)
VEAGAIVERAVKEAIEELASMLASLEDELFAGRAADVRDVGRRILRVLLDLPPSSLIEVPEPSIIVAYDLTPSDTAGLEPELTLGLCTEAGGLTSHTAILARTLGIPAVVGLGAGLMQEVADGRRLILDGTGGRVILDPERGTVERFREQQDRRERWLDEVRAQASGLAHTAEGRRVEVGANVGDVRSAAEAVAHGAEGIGLLRTEFLYLEETRPPSEEKQIQAYREIFEELGDRPVIVRTLDIGGDKPPTYLDFHEELNPFLGWRAIRISLDELDLFKTQLRAILRAAAGHNVLLMFPMISGLEELRQGKAALGEARASLEAEGLPHAGDLPVGIMVETPAAVALGDLLAAECDFFSLGTNDLTQYTLAVDRTNERVADRYQPLHPAVLRMIKATIDAGHAQGIWVGMCGELAGMQRAIPILLGLGLDEFSMVARAIPEAKWLISQLEMQEVRELADQVLAMGTAVEVEERMQAFLDVHRPARKVS